VAPEISNYKTISDQLHFLQSQN